MKKNVLALDLGIASIGHSLIQFENETLETILDMGVLYIPDSSNKSYIKGDSDYKLQTPTAIRRQKRAIRVCKRHKQQNKKRVLKWLRQNFKYKKIFLDDLHLIKIKALTEKITLSELSAIIYNYSKYRGYNEIDGQFILDEKETQFFEKAKTIKEWTSLNNKTVSEYYLAHPDINLHHNNLEKQPVILQELYIDEFTKIWNNQKQYYSILTDENFIDIKRIVYFRKPLKSSRHLKNDCDLEFRYYKNEKGEVIKKGLKVTPRCNPIFQEFRAWSEINNLKLKIDFNEHTIDDNIKQDIFKRLKEVKTLKANEIISIIKSYPRYIGNKYELNYKELKGLSTYVILAENNLMGDISTVWKDIYSKTNLSKYNLTKTITLENDNCAYSEKALKNLLPHMNGEIDYLSEYDAKQKLYTNILNVPTQLLKSELSLIDANTLRNPKVTKIVNNAIKLVKKLEEKYQVDEIRIELARELRNSTEKRKLIHERNEMNGVINKHIKGFIDNNYTGINSESIKNIEKVKLWLEQGGVNIKNIKLVKEKLAKPDDIKSICLYSNTQIDYKQIFYTSLLDIEHTIPKSIQYDNSFNNKTLTYKVANQIKNNKTGYEYAVDKGSEFLQSYTENINKIYKSNQFKLKNFLYGNKLTYSNALDLSEKEEFSANALIDTSYITKYISNHLRKYNYKVRTTTGSLTSLIRNMNLSFDETEQVHLSSLLKQYPLFLKDPNDIRDEKDKRDDNRHHALDAFIIGITKDSYVNLINKVNNRNEESNFNKIRNDIVKTLCGEDPKSFMSGTLLPEFDKILVKQLKPKYVLFKKKGCLGVRGQLHEETKYGYSKKENILTFRELYIKGTTKDILDSSGISEHTKKVKVRCPLGSKIEIGNKKYVKTGNNIMTLFDENNKGETISLLKYTKENVNITSINKLKLHKGDFIILGNTKDEIASMTQNKDFSFYKNVYYITEVSKTNVFCRPHYIPNGGEVSFNRYIDKDIKCTEKEIKDTNGNVYKKNDIIPIGATIILSKVSKDYYISKGLNSLINEYGSITKLSCI